MTRALGKIFLTCCVILTLSACSSKKQVADEAPANIQPVDCVLVMPTSTTVDSSSKIQYEQAEELQKGAMFVDTLLANKFGAADNVKIVNGNQLETYFPEVKGGITGVIKEVGTKLGCEAMLFTTVSKFTQRDGSSYAVDSPASAAFSMELIDVKSGGSLWTSSFNETQEAVLSNIFSWGKAESRGFKWITVEDLMEQGFNERLEENPYL